MSAKNDVESFLEDLDNLVPKNQSSSENKSTENQNKEASTSGATSNQQSNPNSAADAQSLLDDLDSLVQQRRSTNISSSNKSSSSSTKPTSQQSDNPSTTTTISTTSTTNTTQPQSTTDPNPTTTNTSSTSTGGGGGWGGWGGSVWSSATRIADQARLELERRAQEAATAYDQLQKSTSQSQQQNSNGNEKNLEGSGGGSGDDVHQPIQDPTLPITNATPQEQERARETAEILRKEISRRGWAFAQGLRGLVAEGGLEKLGSNLTSTTRKGLTDLLNAVAPPISSHEVLQVTLSHDLKGYDGISDVVFRVLTSVMESHHSNLRNGDDHNDGRGFDQQLVVNKAPNRKDGGGKGGERPKDDGDDERDLNAVEGFEAGKKLAEAELASLIKSHSSSNQSESSTSDPISNLTVPVTNCPIFVRIQPVISNFPWSSSSDSEKKEESSNGSLFFIILLRDPGNGLSHETLSQSLPRNWMDIAFEENIWVEQALVDVLQGALSVIGQDYVNGRMSGRSRPTQLPGSLTSTSTDSKDEKPETS